MTPKRTRPYRPQTNGKVERFHRILLEEWAYIRDWRTDRQRTAAYDGFMHFYNHHRSHGALGWSTPTAPSTASSGTTSPASTPSRPDEPNRPTQSAPGSTHDLGSRFSSTRSSSAMPLSIVSCALPRALVHRNTRTLKGETLFALWRWR